LLIHIVMRTQHTDAALLPHTETGGLVLWHASWFAATLICQTIAVTLAPIFGVAPSVRPLAIGWSALGIPFILVEAWLIAATWSANARFRQPIFGNVVFALLVVLLAGIAALTLWTIVMLARVHV
jgi:hypothetical protein